VPKKNRLAALRKKKTVVKPKGGGGMDGLEDAIVGDMARSMTSLGAIQAAQIGHDWTERTFKVNPDLSISVRAPSAMVVDMDGFDLVTELVRAAEAVYPKVAVAIHTEGKWAGPTHQSLKLEPTQKNTHADIIVAIVRQLLKLQEWAYIARLKRFRAPSWLNPPIMLKWETLEMMVREEIQDQAALPGPVEEEPVEAETDFGVLDIIEPDDVKDHKIKVSHSTDVGDILDNLDGPGIDPQEIVQSIDNDILDDLIGGD